MSLFRDPPTTQYADTGNGWVGYEVFGDGPSNVLLVSSVDDNVEAIWDIPQASVLRPAVLVLQGRLLRSRGHGTSDPVAGLGWPTFESIADDALYVMDAAGFDRTTVIGDVEGGYRALYFVAAIRTEPCLWFLLNSFARFVRSEDYPIGIPERAFESLSALMASTWGTPAYYLGSAPSLEHDLPTRIQLARYQRLSNSPGAVDPIVEFYQDFDVRWILPSIQVPTLVICRKDADSHRPTHSRYMAAHIPDAEFGGARRRRCGPLLCGRH